MSIRYRILSTVIRLMGIKKFFAKPMDEILAEARAANAKKRFTAPTNHKAVYQLDTDSNGDQCLRIQRTHHPSTHAVMYLFGGGFITAPDSKDIRAAVKLGADLDCDVWMPNYPLCIDHTIDDTYDMVFRCYADMVEVYGAGHVSLIGFSSGAALALGIGLHNTALGRPLPMPATIVMSSPGLAPCTPEDAAVVDADVDRDIILDGRFMARVHTIMTKGKDIPSYMVDGTKGDFRGLPPLHFYFGGDELLVGFAPRFVEACQRAGVDYTMVVEPGMCHCYGAVPYFPEGARGYRQMLTDLREAQK